VNYQKSSWKPGSRQAWTFFCPLCRSQRILAQSPRPHLGHAFQIGLTSLVIAAAAWPWCGAKGLLSFVPLWTVFELVFRLRLRARLSCPHCGFDPYLYKTDVRRARGEVERFWRKRFQEKGVPFPGDPVPPGDLPQLDGASPEG
jgi:predicted RNA-binding Zn-ribbon protein involved in translation (DUF1610 family)